MTLSLCIVGFITALSYWRRDIFLYVLNVPGPLMIGFNWYQTHHDDTGFVIAVTIIAVGVYSFWKVVENLIERLKP